MKALGALADTPIPWVVLCLFMVLAPHFSRMPLWMVGLASLLFAWRLLAIRKPNLMPRKWVLLVFALLSSLGAYFHYGTLFGKNAGTAFLAVLLGIKLLESRGHREFMLLVALSFFIIVTNFLFSQTIPTVIYMFLTVIVLVMTLVRINQDDAPITVNRRFKLASKMVFQALPLMLVLFVLFPRIPGPLWKLPDDARIARTGLSDTMTPGSISRLTESAEVAFRVEFEGNPPPQQRLYWRALILWHFDGRTWDRGKPNVTSKPVLETQGWPVRYTVTLEPHDQRWLFALDIPAENPPNSRYTPNFSLRAKSKITSLHQYTLLSYLDYRIQNQLTVWEKNAGLQLPANSNPETVALGKQWRMQLQDPQAIVRQALNHFNREAFRYTLRPPMTPGFDPVDQFLFDTRAGFCEHYASSFTLLMRAAGIPARVVTGYQGGTWNPINNFLTVRQNDAHAWSEVWLADRGWIRVDPTAAIAPERIEHNLDAALPENEFRPLHMRMDVGLYRKLKFYWDALDNGWNQWIIGYGPELQQQFLSELLGKDVDFRDMGLLLIAAMTLVTLLVMLLILRSQPVPPPDPYQRVYLAFCRKLARRGLQRNDYDGPLSFAGKATERFPQFERQINLITGLYINDRYRSRGSREQLEQMKRAVKRLRFSGKNSKKVHRESTGPDKKKK